MLILTYLIDKIFVRRRFSWFKSIVIILSVCVGFYFLMEIPEVKIFMYGFTADDNAAVNMNGLSSGRLELYAHEYNRFYEHPVFGNGMIFNTETSVSGSHNMIIELLVQSGIVGLILYIVPVILVLKQAYANRNQRHMKGWLLFLIAILLHGMIEVNFFNYSTDLLFWTACGIVMSSNKKIAYEPRIIRNHPY